VARAELTTINDGWRASVYRRRTVARLMASTVVATMVSTPSWPSSAEDRRGSPVTPSAVPPAAPGRELVAADERRIDRPGERGVRQPGVRPDLVVADAVTAQRLRVGRGRCLVVLEDRVGARRRGRPLAIEALRDRGQAFLVAAVIADEHDVAKAVQLEAPARRTRAAARTSRRAR
jgi:hypothetical protein